MPQPAGDGVTPSRRASSRGGSPSAPTTPAAQANPVRSITDDWFARDTLDVARELVGARIVFGGLEARIVEVEAYKGDAASHFVTRPRTAAMMGATFGRLYVYSIYGVHRCVNVTTERDGPGAVLLRALEPIRGAAQMRRRRGLAEAAPDTAIASGPAKLFVALGLDPSIHGLRAAEVFTITPADRPVDVATGPRIGISKARGLPWRFYERGNRHVSRG